MKYLEELEKEHIDYADKIEKFLDQPQENEQLINLIQQIINYLRYAGEEIHICNQYVNDFIELIMKLP